MIHLKHTRKVTNVSLQRRSVRPIIFMLITPPVGMPSASVTPAGLEPTSPSGGPASPAELATAQRNAQCCCIALYAPTEETFEWMLKSPLPPSLAQNVCFCQCGDSRTPPSVVVPDKLCGVTIQAKGVTPKSLDGIKGHTLLQVLDYAKWDESRKVLAWGARDPVGTQAVVEEDLSRTTCTSLCTGQNSSRLVGSPRDRTVVPSPQLQERRCRAQSGPMWSGVVVSRCADALHLRLLLHGQAGWRRCGIEGGLYEGPAQVRTDCTMAQPVLLCPLPACLVPGALGAVRHDLHDGRARRLQRWRLVAPALVAVWVRVDIGRGVRARARAQQGRQ